MNDNQIEKLAHSQSQALGEALTAILGAIRALTKQPNFNAQHFDAEICSLQNHPHLTEMQREILSSLLTQATSKNNYCAEK